MARFALLSWIILLGAGTVLGADNDNKARLEERQAQILFNAALRAADDGAWNIAYNLLSDYESLYPQGAQLAEIPLWQARWLERRQYYRQAAEKFVEYYRRNPGPSGEEALAQAVNLYSRMGWRRQAARFLTMLREQNPASLQIAVIENNMALRESAPIVKSDQKPTTINADEIVTTAPPGEWIPLGRD